ncbi:Plexin [Gracilaria domingensis]|nr:Plexin [Gracilaria domingensis]
MFPSASRIYGHLCVARRFIAAFILLTVLPVSHAFSSSSSQHYRSFFPSSASRFFRSFDLQSTDLCEEPHQLRSLFVQRQVEQAPIFLTSFEDPELVVSLINGTAETEISYVFVPEPGFTLSDYRFEAQIEDATVFNSEDLSFFTVADNSRGFLAYNVTALIDFNKWSGKSAFEVRAVNVSSSETVASSQSISIIVVGITFYRTEDGNRVIYGGENFPFVLSTDQVRSSQDQNFEVFIQYYDGSSTNSSITVPLTGIQIESSGSRTIATHGGSCSPVTGVYDGSDVQLSEQCGMGFSANDLEGEYVGPKFGVDINEYANGTLITSFEWDEIVQGSDLEADGYSTFLNISIVGEVPPLVQYVSPPGPFRSTGGDTAVFTIANVPNDLDAARSWTYSLSINFSEGLRDATVDVETIQVNANGTVSMLFTLPAGVGTDLPWVFTAVKPSGEQLVGIDQTSPSYLFTFAANTFIDSITPVSGPEAGGTEVTLVGEFPNHNTSTLNIFFDGTLIDSSLISSTSLSSITFVTPPKASGGNFEQIVTVEVGGITSNGVTFTYEPVVRLESMTPAQGPAAGGTLVTLFGQFIGFDASVQNSGIYFGSTKIDSSLIQTANATTISFATPPQISVGDASVFVYDVTVHVDGSVSNSLQFSYDAPVLINAITPNSGPEQGGTLVTLTGQFINFDPSSSSIFIGAVAIDEAEIVSSTDSQLQFITPPLGDVGQSYSQPVTVTIDSLTSNSVTFIYEESNAGVSITSTGGSFDSDSGQYRLGLCSDGLFRAVVSPGWRVLNLTYSWTLIAPDGTTDVLLSPSITTDADALLVPFAVFQTQNEPYSLQVVVQSESVSSQASLTLIQLNAQAISVRVIDPRARSLSNPNVSLTIPSIIGLPGCPDPTLEINSTAMTFVWQYRSSRYHFSYLNTTAPRDEISPTLLGREFHIPQLLMEYGSFPLSLLAYFTDQPEIRASDSTTVMIRPAELLAQINGGEVSQLVSSSQDFVMSASGSRDPDVLSGDDAVGLRYQWSCRFSWNSALDFSEQCDANLMPDEGVTRAEFTVSSSALQTVQNSSGPMYIEYSLQVSKTSQNATGAVLERNSEIVTSTLILPEDTPQIYESLSNIAVINNLSTAVDLTNVKYYEDVVITPVSGTNETTWSYQALLPASQAQTLLATDENLLTFAGYYTAGAEPGRDSLGIKANVLSPNTEYSFLIRTFRAGFGVNEQTISLKTVEQPVVTIGKLLRSSGTTNDTFTLSAYANYDGDFKFFFLVTDEFGFESCVGGCQGTEFVSFQLGTVGNYSVRCDVYDSLGFTLLASTAGGSILVTSSADNEADLSSFAADAEDAFVAGDHSDYHQVGTDMVKFILSAGGSSSSTDSDALANFTAGLNQIAANSVPNAIQSAGYVRTAAALASLTPDLGVIYNTETLYLLVNITINAVQRTPDTAALQQLQDLLDFYDLTPELIMASYSEGTSRTRLRQSMEVSEEEIIGIWLDVYEVMKEQLVLAVLKKCPCGCEEEVRTGISAKGRGALRARLQTMRQENSSLSAAAAYVNPTQGELSEVRMKLAHFCNSEQGLGLALDVGMERPVEFSWCKGLLRIPLTTAAACDTDGRVVRHGCGCNQQQHCGGRVVGHQGLLWAANPDCARSGGRRGGDGGRSGAEGAAAATEQDVGRKRFSDVVRAGVRQHQHGDRAGRRGGAVLGGAVDAVEDGGGDGGDAAGVAGRHLLAGGAADVGAAGGGGAVASADAGERGRGGGVDGGGAAGGGGGGGGAGGRGRNVRGARRVRSRHGVPGGRDGGGGGGGGSRRGGARVSPDGTDGYHADCSVGAPLGRIVEHAVQDGHERDAVGRARALPAAVGAHQLGALAGARDDDALHNFAHQVVLERLDGGGVAVGVVEHGVDQRRPRGGGGVAADVREPAAEVAEAGGLDDARLADVMRELRDSGLDCGRERRGARLAAAAPLGGGVGLRRVVHGWWWWGGVWGGGGWSGCGAGVWVGREELVGKGGGGGGG